MRASHPAETYSFGFSCLESRSGTRRPGRLTVGDARAGSCSRQSASRRQRVEKRRKGGRNSASTQFCIKKYLTVCFASFFSYLLVTVSLDISRFVSEHVVNAFSCAYHEFDSTRRLDFYSHLRITKTITSKAIFCLFLYK